MYKYTYFFDEKCFFIFHFSEKKIKTLFLLVFMAGFSQKSIEILLSRFPLINLDFLHPKKCVKEKLTVENKNSTWKLWKNRYDDAKKKTWYERDFCFPICNIFTIHHHLLFFSLFFFLALHPPVFWWKKSGKYSYFFLLHVVNNINPQHRKRKVF